MRILFVVNEPGEFVELRRVANDLCRRDGTENFFLFGNPDYALFGSHSGSCIAKGYPFFKVGSPIRFRKYYQSIDDGYITLSMMDFTNHRRLKVAQWLLDWARRWLLGARAFLLLLAGLALTARRLWRMLSRLSWRPETTNPLSRGVDIALSYDRFSRKIVRLIGPDIMIFGQDHVDCINPFLIHWAKRFRVRTLIIPFALGTAREICESLWSVPELDVEASLANRLTAYFFPKWVNYYNGKRMLRALAYKIFWLELKGISSEHPWLPNWSKVDKIAVESDVMMRYYRYVRFPEDQLELTGALCDDILYERGQRKKQNKADEPLKILVAWPSNQFSANRDVDFDNYEALCKYLGRFLTGLKRRSGANIIAKLHPTIRISTMEWMNLPPYLFDIEFVRPDTATLVPDCDLFIATVSSTIRWAIACGKPVVNFDVYRYGYRDFHDARGVVTVSEVEEFEAAVNRLVDDRSFFAEISRRQAACAPEWGRLDGQSGERIRALIRRLAEEDTGWPAAKAV